MPFQLLPEFPPHTANNACCSCKSDRRPTDRLIDLGFSIDMLVDNNGTFTVQEGWAILCETCAKEVAGMLGYATDDISAELTAMRAEIKTLREEKARLELVAEAVQDAIHA